MNERIRELATQARKECVRPGIYTEEEFEQKFAEFIIRDCAAVCEQVASDAGEMANSKFVTGAGRMLHEGMWGGAKNCSAGIRAHFFGVEE